MLCHYRSKYDIIYAFLDKGTIPYKRIFKYKLVVSEISAFNQPNAAIAAVIITEGGRSSII